MGVGNPRRESEVLGAVFTGRARVDFLRKDHADDAVAVGIVTIRGTEAKVSSVQRAFVRRSCPESVIRRPP